MEFMNRSNQQSQAASQTTPAPASSAPGSAHKASKRRGAVGLYKLSFVALLFSATILVVALLLSLFFGNAKPENKYVKKDTLQAVFLNNGQVYFGNILSLNEKYVRVGNIYYLRVNQQVQPNQSTSTQAQDISLVKLGCELHGPTDEMLINRDQVTFWENLKTDGQVSKAVAQYKQQNPNGQKCDTAASGSTTPSSTTPAATTPTTNSSSTKKQ